MLSTAQNISSIIQARLPGSTLIATDNEEMVVTRIQEGTDHRDRGCFINGTGTKKFCVQSIANFVY